MTFIVLTKMVQTPKIYIIKKVKTTKYLYNKVNEQYSFVTT